MSLNKIFDWNGRSGTLIDSVSGTKGTLTASKFIRENKGLCLMPLSATGQLSFSINNTFQSSSHTYEFWYKKDAENTSYYGVFGKDDGTNGFRIYTQPTGVLITYSLRNGATSATSSVVLANKGWMHIMIVIDWDVDNLYFYVNNSLVSTSSIAALNPATCNNTAPLTLFDNVSNGNTDIAERFTLFRIYSGTLSADERNALYEQFLNASQTLIPTSGWSKPKITDSSDKKENELTANAVVNGGAGNTTDWVDSNADGLADSWRKYAFFGTNTASIVTGNGFMGNAQRLECTSSGSDQNISTNTNIITIGKKYILHFKYRCNASMRVLISGSQFISTIEEVTNTGDAISRTYIFTAAYTGALSFYLRRDGRYNIQTGDYLEVDEVSIQELTGEVAHYNMQPIGTTLVDISGGGYNGTITGALSTKDGMKFDGVNDTVSYVDNHTGSFSACIRCMIPETPSGSAQLMGRGIGDWYLTGNSTAGQLNARVETTSIKTISATNAYKNGVPFDAVLVYDQTNIILYVNGVEANRTAQTGAVIDSGNIYLGSYNGGNFFANCEIMDYKYYNYAVTAQQAKDYHNQWRLPQLVEQFKNNGADGLNILPDGWIGGTGSFKIDEFCKAKGELVTNGTMEVGDPISTGWINNNGTPSKVTGNGFIGYAQRLDAPITITTFFHQITVPVVKGKRYKFSFKHRSNNGVCAYIIGTVTYINTIYTNTGDAVHITPIEFTSIDTGNLDIRFYCRNSTGGTQAGDWIEVDDVSLIEIDPLPDWKDGTRYMECITGGAGTIAIPSKWANGEMEIDLYSGNLTTNYSYAWFIQQDMNNLTTASYRIGFQINGIVQLTKWVATAPTICLQTSPSYIRTNTWYRVKLIRSNSNVITVLMKGGSLTPTAGYDGWTLVSNGGGGSNPFTDSGTIHNSSNFIVADLDAGDRIANIKSFNQQYLT